MTNEKGEISIRDFIIGGLEKQFEREIREIT